MKVIDMPGLAKVSSGDLLRELTNELARVRRRLKRAQAKLEGLRTLKEDLQPYLQPGDYEYLLERLKREVTRRAGAGRSPPRRTSSTASRRREVRKASSRARRD